MTHEFRDAEFMSAREKELVLKAWVRFLRNGLRFTDFTDRLYKYLTLHCSFIAHYSRAGFFTTYFENGEDIARFLCQFDRRDECHSIEYGGSWWCDGEYADLNRAMIEEGASYISNLIAKAQSSQREADISHAHEPPAKHGLEKIVLRSLPREVTWYQAPAQFTRNGLAISLALLVGTRGSVYPSAP